MRAIAYTNELLALHFSSLNWFWSDTLLQVKSDLLMNGEDVSLDCPELSRLVQRLGASRELPVFDLPVYGQPAGKAAQQLITYQRQAVRALTELLENPQACGPLVFGLVTLLARSRRITEHVDDVTHENGERRLNSPSAETIEKLLKSLDGARRVVDLAVVGEGGYRFGSAINSAAVGDGAYLTTLSEFDCPAYFTRHCPAPPALEWQNRIKVRER